jgi:multidrug resistance efflux pump
VSVREVGAFDGLERIIEARTGRRQIGFADLNDGKSGERKKNPFAEVEPDVTQAQSLSDVQAGVRDSRLRLEDAQRDYANQKALFDNGLVGSDALKASTNRREIAEQTLRAAETRYRIVEEHGIPISGDSTTQKARVTSPMNGVVIKKGVELGETVTSGVSSFNEGTVLFTVADLKSLIIRVNLNEVDIAKVHVGQPARITLDAYPQKVFTGKVSFVAPSAELVEK